MQNGAPEVLRNARESMVRNQLERRGVRDPRVLEAMRTMPRHLFVPERLEHRAYDDCALPIDHQQTISQPYIVAASLEALELTGDERVLEVGAGSGYQAALLGRLAAEVIGVEVIEELVDSAGERLRELGADNVTIVHGDGWKGWPAQAPYDAIVVAAAADELPPALVEQLKDGGRMVVPVGQPYSQSLLKLTKTGDTLEREEICRCVFVPLIHADDG